MTCMVQEAKLQQKILPIYIYVKFLALLADPYTTYNISTLRVNVFASISLCGMSTGTQHEMVNSGCHVWGMIIRLFIYRHVSLKDKDTF
jgi:hypothetical protein